MPENVFIPRDIVRLDPFLLVSWPGHPQDGYRPDIALIRLIAPGFLADPYFVSAARSFRGLEHGIQTIIVGNDLYGLGCGPPRRSLDLTQLP